MKDRFFFADVELNSWIKTMGRYRDQSLPACVAASLNAAAEASTKQAKRNVENRLIVRTKYTTNSIRQDRHARGTNIDRMHSRTSSISPYLAIQNYGGTIKAEGSRIPIPTLQARTSKSIQRSIARRYRMNQLGTFDGGSKFFMGKPKGTNWPAGIYERHGKGKLRMIRNLEQSQVKISGVHWHDDAIKKYGTRQFIRSQFIRHAKRRVGAT